MNLLPEVYACRYPIAAEAERYAEVSLTNAQLARLAMTATLMMMAAVCFAGILFMLRFLVALSRESKPKNPGRVVFLPSRNTPTENEAFGLIPGAQFGRRGPRGKSRLQVIADGHARPARRVG